MDIETLIDPEQVTLRIRGNLTRADCDQLGGTVVKLLEEGHRHFVMDLGEVPRLDSAGLGSVVAASTAVYRAGGTIRIERGDDRNHELLSKIGH